MIARQTISAPFRPAVRAGQPWRRSVVMLSGGSAIRGPYQRRTAVAASGRGSDGATASGAGSRMLP
ncbi:hypothetical protein AB0K49_31500 [Streptomyces decoyicus]|uniref:hypothetical protein n=1 Tax=Streptomyces decoyicus TaxID=249567 RepID=UPI00345DED07